MTQLFVRVIGLVACLALILPAMPAFGAGDTGSERRTFRQLGYGDQTARSVSSTASYYLPFPQGQAPATGTSVDLSFSHSPLLISDHSTMTVVANGQSLASTFLTADNQANAHLTVSLPTTGIVGSGISLEIQFSMRVTRDACEDPKNPALWTTIFGDSAFTVVPGGAGVSPGLENLATILTPAAPDSATTIVAPVNPNDEELAALGTVSFQLGQWSRVQGRPVQIYVIHPDDPSPSSIIVGMPGSIGLNSTWGKVNWSAGSFQVNGTTIPSQHGILALSDGAPARLLISGGSGAGVLLAADAMADIGRQPLLTGDHAIITGVPIASNSSPPWIDSAASFAQLGFNEQIVNGSGEHFIDQSFSRPANWQLSAGSALDLVVDSSTAAKSDLSWVSISVNGHDIGTQPLQQTAGTVTHLRFELPTDLLNATLQGQPVHQLGLQVRVYLDSARAACVPEDSAALWAKVLPTSSWILPHTTSNDPNLGSFPAPFASDTSAAPTIVVIPDQPTPAELTAATDVIGAIGRLAGLATKSNIVLKEAGKVTDSDRQHANLIVVGSAERNSVLAAA